MLLRRSRIDAVMTLRHPALLALLGLAAACSSAHPAAAPRPKPPRTDPAAAAVTCRTTPVRHGAAPRWTAPAWSTSSPGFSSNLWFAVSAHGDAVAVLFAHPLRAGKPQNPANKVLWVVRRPRRGQPLRLHAQPIGVSARGVTTSWPANSSPGEIYPSTADVSFPGCWRFTLRWAGHVDTIALPYGS
jgi:hypothetical protein